MVAGDHSASEATCAGMCESFTRYHHMLKELPSQATSLTDPNQTDTLLLNDDRCKSIAAVLLLFVIFRTFTILDSSLCCITSSHAPVAFS